jgi:hypothetical protein
VDENLHPGFEVFPSNLPELRSLYFLARDVQTVVGGQPLRILMLSSTYSRYPLSERFQKDNADYDKYPKPRLIERNTDGYQCFRGH